MLISKKRRRFFETSRASAAEVGACLDLAQAFQLTSIEKACTYKDRISAISRMIFGLMR